MALWGDFRMARAEVKVEVLGDRLAQSEVTALIETSAGPVQWRCPSGSISPAGTVLLVVVAPGKVRLPWPAVTGELELDLRPPKDLSQI
jgi:hypothetical protein